MNTMVIQKTFSFRLDPSKNQCIQFAQYAGSARYIFNYGLSSIKKALEEKNKIPTYTDIANKLPRLKKATETAWLKTIHSQVLQQSLKDLDSGMKSFYRRLKAKQTPGFPRFKCKGIKDSFRFPQYIKCENSKVYLPKIGWVKYRNSRPLEGMIKQATVKRHGIHWNIHIVCEIAQEISEKAIDSAKIVGIDVGLLNFAYLSNGIVIENPTFLKKDLRRLQHAQKKHSRKKRGSKNRKKSALKLNKLHERIANKRRDFLHKVSTDIVENQDVIIVEDLNIKGMVQNRHLSRSLSDAGLGEFMFFLKYKTGWQGKKYVQIDRFVPTSKRCSSCENKQDMPLRIRRYKCNACGINLDRDYNAALNIRAAGLAILKACGELSNGGLDEAGVHGFQAV